MIAPRVNEVMYLLATGHPPREVASRMTIEPDGVAVYVHAYRRATGTTSRRDAIRHYLLTNGMSDPDGARSTYATLPRRLRSIADLLAQGVTDYADMVAHTGVKASTLHVYVSRLRERFRVQTQLELIRALRKAKL